MRSALLDDHIQNNLLSVDGIMFTYDKGRNNFFVQCKNCLSVVSLKRKHIADEFLPSKIMKHVERCQNL